jgi:protocatechuate 3,4-dioxygenase beta subunit
MNINMILLFVAALAAQAQQPRDIQVGTAAGTAVLSGTLVTDETPSDPVRRATISLIVSDPRNPRLAVTDDAGRFTFTKLAPGTFTLSASKAGYVTAYYGAKRPGRGPGMPVVIPAGQQVSVAMKMLKGAVISGTVVDPQGRPAAGAGFQLMQYRVVNGERTLYGAYGGYGYTSTDDRGMYRAYGLAPGDYLVVATGRSYGDGAIREMTAADIQWAQQQFQTTDATRPGDAALGRSTTTATVVPAQTVINAPVYFPGTVDLAAATMVTVGPGEERDGVNFAIQFVPTAKIDGTVVDTEGRPAPNVSIKLISMSLQPGDFVMAMGMTSRGTDANGKFSIPGIAPGRYTITGTARATGGAMTTPGAASAAPGRGATPPPGPGGATFWAMREVVVDGHDQSDVSLTLEPGMSVSGRVAFDGPTPAPQDLTRTAVSVTSVQTSGGLSVSVPRTPMNADGTFTVAGLPPGRYRIGASLPGGTSGGVAWILKSAMSGERDAADLPLEIKPNADVTGVVVTFTDHAAEIAGTVLDPAGRPTAAYSIIVFPADKALWLAGARRVRPTRPANDGTFAVAGLPAGEYFICAATDYDQGDLSDPAFLAQLAAASYKVTLADGEKKRQDLKIAGGQK